ncbi:transcription factor MafB [Cimex lectularius]|uniref:Basic leucine zipper domain-containing protein n=1 Tax=Cimex lectularius TaxID=79782 RepID=A0A8I6RNJ9_CIMLE|nr:transcription factor MafB [Cimex lectularius]
MENSSDKMEAEDGQLAAQYVQEFVLDHLEDVSVKKEGGMERLPSMLSCGGGVVQMSSPQPHHHLLTPPGHQSEDYNVVTMSSQHQPMMMQHSIYPDTPGTPPDTPPESTSPHSPPNRQYHLEQSQLLLPQRPPQGVVDEMGWIMANGGPLRQEPLDLRPNCGGDPLAEDWVQLQHGPVINPGKRILEYHHQHHHHHHHPDDDLEMSPSTPMQNSMQMQMQMSVPMKGSDGRSSAEDIISDELLMCLTVRELNKRLQGFPREEVVRLKQKRRTLKNRGYAQNCRSKRLHQRHELEMTNRSLQNELHRIKQDHSRISQERDMYKLRCEALMKRLEGRENIPCSPASTTYM